MSELTVEFAGEVRLVSDALTFGRSADLLIDENNYMHRIVGEFFVDGGLWWLRNRGSRIPLTLLTNDGKRVQLPPSVVQALSGGGGVVRFQAGPTTYELSYQGAANEPDSGAAPSVDGVEQTMHFEFAMTPREVDYLACFCAPQFGQSTKQALPTYAQVADVWGVSVKTLDNTLQNLRRKIKDAGFAGVDSADSLVTFVLAHGLIGRSDLDWAAINEPEGPRQASIGPRFASPSS